MKKVKYFLISLILLLCCFMGNTKIVNAASKYVNRGSKYYYKNSGSNAGEYTSSSSGGHYTVKKELCDSSLKGCTPAYCAQAHDTSPKQKEKYNEYFKNENSSLVAGRVIADIKKKYTDTKKQYTLIYATLNTYLKLDSYRNFGSSNKEIRNFIDQAKEEVKNQKTGTTLPNFEMAVESVVRNGNNFVGVLKLTGLNKDYGGDAIKYTISASTGVTLDKTSIDGSVDTQSVNFTASVDYNAKITFQVKASNSSTYQYARFWRSSGNPSAHQDLVTSGSKTYARVRDKEISYITPSRIPSQKELRVTKVSNDTGRELSGADLNITLTKNGQQIGKSCNTSGQSSCVINNVSEDYDSVDYTITEVTSPLGYVKGKKAVTGTWKLSANTQTCRKQETATSDWQDTDLVDCDRQYKSDVVCKITDKTTKKVTYEEGECPLPNPDAGNSGTTGGTDSGNNNTGDSTDSSGSSSGSDSSTTNPDDSKTEEETTTKESLADKCYYKDNDTIQIVDDSKCANTYMKITTYNGNMQIQYTNDKNELSISKRAISGTDEILGAELKICSDEPNEKGECTIVKNTAVGQCKSNAFDDGEKTADSSNLSSDVPEILTGEYNCNYDASTGLKTLDMHWYSTTIAKKWRGLQPGTYYLVETVAPKGYIVSTETTKFTIDNDGKVTTDGAEVENDSTIILRNKLTEMSISKTDIATSKELPGAEMMICNAYQNSDDEYKMILDNNGYCQPVVLADGSQAQWTSTDKPKTITGLGKGSYYLVERTAPSGYSTAESILFIMNEDGTLSDINGKSLANNKIVMKDKKMEEVKTGDLPIIPIVILGVIAIGGGIYFYYNLNKTTPSGTIKEISNKIRRRKIHK